MTTKSRESKHFVDLLTQRYHDRTGNYPTKEQAIRMIRKARRDYLTPPRNYWSDHVARQRTFSRYMALELIRRIGESEEQDPIRVIYEVYDWLDETISVDEHGQKVWRFSSAMKDAISEIVDLLGMRGANT